MLLKSTPESTRFAICIETYPMPAIGQFSLTVSPYRRPRPDMGPDDGEGRVALCQQRANYRRSTQSRFSNALSLDINDHVAETASTNVFMVRDQEILTPVPNGMFLNG